MAVDAPGFVVDQLKVQEWLAQFRHGGESLHPEQVFLEASDKAFGATVDLGSPDKG